MLTKVFDLSREALSLLLFEQLEHINSQPGSNVSTFDHLDLYLLKIYIDIRPQILLKITALKILENSQEKKLKFAYSIFPDLELFLKTIIT